MLNNGIEGSPVDRPTESSVRPGLVPLLQHADVWRGIDRLAAKHGLSASGLARRAGLDPTAFNPSKRITREGRPRWPSTESVAKVLTVTGESFSSFVQLTGAPGTGEGTAFQGGNVEIVTGVVLPPDFTTFWTQANQMGFKPKAVSVGKCILFPVALDALGKTGNNLSSEVWWSPTHPYTSSLNGQSAGELADGFTEAPGAAATFTRDTG